MTTFKRKATFADEEGVMYPDNDEPFSLQRGSKNGKNSTGFQTSFMFMDGWQLCCLFI
jgi:hypothetical protein